jgi:alcohol dehydrogenase, propanol-preferring
VSVPESMRAAVLDKVGGPLTVREVPTPRPGPGEVLVRVGASGLCHSDLHMREGAFPGLPKALPWVMGHENAGTVAELGAGVSGIQVGDRVVVFGGWGCGMCRLCLGGSEQLCNLLTWVGIGAPGGYAEYLVVPSPRHLVRLTTLDLAMAAPLSDAALTPYRAVKKARGRLVPGTTAVSIGVGGLGQFGVQFLRRMTPSQVIAIDPMSSRRARAQELGADAVFDSGDASLAEDIRELAARRRGADVVIDYVGSDETLALAASVIGPEGLVVLVGLAGGSASFSYFGWPAEATVTYSRWGSRCDLEEVIAMAESARLNVLKEAFALEDIDQGFEKLERNEVDGRAVVLP